MSGAPTFTPINQDVDDHIRVMDEALVVRTLYKPACMASKAFRNCSLILAGVVLFTHGAIAQDSSADLLSDPPIQLDRPTFTATAALVPRRSVQLEIGIKRTSSPNERKVEWGQLLLRYGLQSNIELRLAPNSFNVIDSGNSQQEGFEDLKLSMKVGLLDEAKGAIPRTTLLPGLLLETGHSEISNGETLPSLTLLFDWSLGGPFSVSSNLGWERAHSNNEKFDKFSASLSLGFQLSDRLSGFAEAYMFDQEVPRGDSTSYGDVGLIYLATHTLSIDATVGSGLSGTETDYFFGIGLGKRW
ncbi:MAG: transporter [Arenicellales bacterium]|nr:transporter [Arenicellales bacterium]